MAKMVSTIGAFVSLVLSFLWLITLTAPWNWLWSQNALVVFKVNLFSIYLDHGIVGKVVKWTTGPNDFTKLLEQSMWIEQGVQELCMLDEIWKWCDTWHMVRFGSIAMAVFGFMVVIFLAAGGGFMYYYAQHHATRTGRLWVLTCVSGAPCCAAIGLLQYVVLTFQMGKGERNILVGTEASYGSGFFFACTLTVFTFVPLYIHMVFGGADEFEKGGDGDNFEAAGQGASYGTWQPSYAPGTGQPAYDYPPPPPVASGGFYSNAPASGEFGLPPPQQNTAPMPQYAGGGPHW